MASEFAMEPMLELFLFETSQLTEQLEQTIIRSESSGGYDIADINEIFRVMHSIKGASSMMLFDNMATFAHCVEDVFFYLREAQPVNVDCAQLSDLLLAGVDYIKSELAKIKCGKDSDGDASTLVAAIQDYLTGLK